MVWFRYKEYGILQNKRKLIKKYRDGRPDQQYFGGGMYANYLYTPPEQNITTYEIFPVLKTSCPNLGHIVTETPRSLELHKELGKTTVRILARSTPDDIKNYVKSLDAEYQDTKQWMLPILSESEITTDLQYWFFDMELANQFNFTSLDGSQEKIIHNLIRVISANKSCGILVQFLFTNAIKWNGMAEASATELSKFLKNAEKGSTKYVFGGFGGNFAPKMWARQIPNDKLLSSSLYHAASKLEKPYRHKSYSTPVTLCIRGVIAGPPDDAKIAAQSISSVFANVSFVGDSLEYFDYGVDAVLGMKWLGYNCISSTYAYEIFQNNVRMWSDMRWGRGRDFVPFLCLTPEEFAVFVSTPTDPTLPVCYRRQKLKSANQDEPLAKLLEGMTIMPEILTRHVYVLGSSGCGKSTLVRNMYKHLERANHTDIQNAAIYIDIKDEDSKLFLRQCEPESFNDDRVFYFDANHTNFAINILELPKYNLSERDAVVSRMVGHIIEMFKEFYSQPQTYVQMERILRLLLFYLYSNTDSPSLLDLYEIIVRLQTGRKKGLKQILQQYDKVTGPEMQSAMDSITNLSRDAWVPLLNRLEMFATDNYLKAKFGVRHTTIDFEKMLEPNNITIFRISDAETPKYAHGLVLMAIVIKIWFTVQHRASVTEHGTRTPVILTLDEFQRISDLSILASILSQARSYDLGLILVHQNLAQIDTKLLETVVGNTATQIYGRVSGIDAGRIAKIMDPHFSEAIVDQIVVQPDFVFTAKTRPVPESEQDPPCQFKALPPPPLMLGDEETQSFVQKMKSRYGSTEKTESIFRSNDDAKFNWMNQLGVKFLKREEWNIIKFLRNNNGNLNQIVKGVQSINRDTTSALIQKLREGGLIDIVNSTKHGVLIMHEYAISQKARELYFPEKFTIIGRTKDVADVAKKAFDHYLAGGHFVCLATQPTGNVPKCDMVAYDYEKDCPISVEIESKNQIATHPEQVRYNMIKWKQLGFARCHVWSKSEKIEEIKNELGAEGENVEVFIDNS